MSQPRVAAPVPAATTIPVVSTGWRGRVSPRPATALAPTNSRRYNPRRKRWEKRGNPDLTDAFIGDQRLSLKSDCFLDDT